MNYILSLLAPFLLAFSLMTLSVPDVHAQTPTPHEEPTAATNSLPDVSEQVEEGFWTYNKRKSAVRMSGMTIGALTGAVVLTAAGTAAGGFTGALIEGEDGDGLLIFTGGVFGLIGGFNLGLFGGGALGLILAEKAFDARHSPRECKDLCVSRDPEHDSFIDFHSFLRVSTMTKIKKKASSRPVTKNSLAPDLDAYLDEMAAEAAGRPLSESLAAGSPFSQLIGRFVELAYQHEMDEHLGYAPHARRLDGEPARTNARNGSSQKTLKTSHGHVEVSVPRDRDSSFEPRVVAKHRRVTEEIEARVLALYAAGMSTRDLREQIAQMYSVEIDGDFVSRLLDGLEPELVAWRNRALEPIYPIVFIDAVHLKVRHDSGVEPTAVYIASGYGESGRMGMLGVWMAPQGETSESASFWHRALVEMRGRGMEDALIVCADGLTGLEEAVGAAYPRARFQPCVVHMVRASLRQVSYKERSAIAAGLRAIYKAPSYEAAGLALQKFAKEWGHRHPGVVAQWEANLPRLLNLWDYGKGLRRLVYTTNPIENTNRQVRKVTKTKGSFPNVGSALRLVTLVLRDVDAKAQGKKSARHDWIRILAELHIHFSDRLPKQWGYRFLTT